jgi:uncharacterized protein
MRRRLPIPSPEELALLDGARAGNPELVKSLLNRGVNPNARDNRYMPFNNTPMMYAAEKGSIEIVELLLRAGADVNATDMGLPLEGGRNTCLHYAARGGFPDMVRRLAAAGGDVNARDTEGKTPLFEAAFEGNLEAVTALLELGAKPDPAKETNWSPLLASASHGHVEICRELLAHGADPNVHDSIGMTPLMQAAGSDSEHADEVAHLLISAGANVHERDQEGHTALCWAVLGANPKTVKTLLEKNANPADRLPSGRALFELAKERYAEGSCDPEEDASYRRNYSEILAILGE